MLDPEDMVDFPPDKKSVLTYMSEFVPFIRASLTSFIIAKNTPPYWYLFLCKSIQRTQG